MNGEIAFEVSQKHVESLTEQLRAAHVELETMRTLARHLEEARTLLRRAGEREMGHINTIRELIEFVRFLEGGVPNAA